MKMATIFVCNSLSLERRCQNHTLLSCSDRHAWLRDQSVRRGKSEEVSLPVSFSRRRLPVAFLAGCEIQRLETPKLTPR